MTKQALLRGSEFNHADEFARRPSAEAIDDEGSTHIFRGLATAIVLSVPVWALVLYAVAA
jgi:hypothetical protein